MKYSYNHGIKKQAALSAGLAAVAVTVFALSILSLNSPRLMSNHVDAKGGVSSGTVSDRGIIVPVTNGDCEDEFTYPGAAYGDYSKMYYPFLHDKNPGIVNALIGGLDGSSTLRLEGVCLSPDWTYKASSYSGGFKVDYFYKGKVAINFTYAPGETTVRYR